MQSILPPSAALCGQMQSYCGHLRRSPKGVQNLIPAGGVRLGQDDVQFELRGVRCGLPTIQTREFAAIGRRMLDDFAPFEKVAESGLSCNDLICFIQGLRTPLRHLLDLAQLFQGVISAQANREPSQRSPEATNHPAGIRDEARRTIGIDLSRTPGSTVRARSESNRSRHGGRSAFRWDADF